MGNTLEDIKEKAWEESEKLCRIEKGRGRVKHLLNHYFELIATRAGVRWDSDNRSEVDEIADEIFDAIREAA